MRATPRSLFARSKGVRKTEKREKGGAGEEIRKINKF